jgi:dihydrolipoamide dehydrogenase
LIASAELYRRIQHANEMGIQVGSVELNIPEMVARAQRIVEEMREGIAALLPTFGIEVLEGQARLIGPKMVEVGGQKYQATRAIVLATGSNWAPLPPGIEEVLRPDEAIRFNPVPGKLLIWGGGEVEVEFATLYSTVGSQVTLAVDGPYPLPKEDYEIGQRLQGILQNQGVQVLNNVRLKSAVRTAEGMKAVLVGPKGETQVVVDKVLWAGRVPALDGLGLAEAGVKLKDGAVVADDRQQTNVPGIYAVGDITGEPLYSSLATVEGMVAAENAMGRTRHLDRRAVPRHMFGIPDMAAVGLTEDQAESEGYDVEVTNISLATNARAMGLGEVEGGIKLVADRKLGKILGVHIVGHRATELIAEATLAIQLETLAEDLAWAIRIHPTLSESMVEAGRAILGQALYLPKF